MRPSELTLKPSLGFLSSGDSVFEMLKGVRVNRAPGNHQRHTIVTGEKIHASDAQLVVSVCPPVRAVLLLRDDSKIGLPVVVNDAVDMINELVGVERSAKLAFHDHPVDVHPSPTFSTRGLSLGTRFLRTDVSLGVVIPGVPRKKVFVLGVNQALHNEKHIPHANCAVN